MLNGSINDVVMDDMKNGKVQTFIVSWKNNGQESVEMVELSWWKCTYAKELR
jgi:hypothetical protein